MQTYTHWSKLRSNFQFKLLLIFSLLTFLVACPLTVLYTVSEIKKNRNCISNELKMRADFLANSVQLPLYAKNRDVLSKLAEKAAQAPEIRAVVILDHDGQVLAGYHAKNSSASPDVISHKVQVYGSQLSDSVEASLTAASSDAAAAEIGSVVMERGTSDLATARRNMIVSSIGSAVIFWLLVTMLCYQALRRVTRSFNALVTGIDVMQKGDLSTRIAVEADDEPGRVASAVNKLAEAVQQRTAENARLQEEHLELERQMLHAQKLESMGVMAGGIAHDYNNLLQAILGNMELALMKLPTDSASKKYITNAMNSGKHAAHLTSMMLTYVGKGFIVKKELDLNELVRENVEMLKMAATTAVSVELNLLENLPVIMADEAHIQQLVMNLIINAAESIEEQPGIVRLSTGIRSCDKICLDGSLLEEKPEPGLFVFFEVSDNGCGMNENTIKRLFDPFFTTKFAGRGLGMSAVMGIIKIHSGAMFVESEPGKGTTFKVLFPITAASLPMTNEKVISAEPEPSLVQDTPLSGLALVVDDEKAVLKICTKMVSICGLEVIAARDGIEAVARFIERADDIAVVLMDLTMPNMDGIAAMNEIHRIRPDARIIISSGFNEDELSERFTGHTPAGYIRKPYSMSVLEAELRRVLRPV